MKILVTGGAGYIGSACTKELLDAGHSVVVVDNMSKGVRDLVDERSQFHQIDLIDPQLDKVFPVDAIIHIAAYKAVGESMDDPVKYNDNITGTLNLLTAMVKHGTKKIIYSSSAALYGMPEYSPLDENHPLKPINYYGYTKLCSEELIKWYSETKGIEFVSLRYFNVVGDYGLKYIDPDPQNVLPILMEAVSGKRDKFVVFGNDYETRDGTCVRDYVHIKDLVKAHVLALDAKNEIINLGSAKGMSVTELVDSVKRVTGRDFPVEIGPRRDGDCAELVASNQKAKEILGWQPKQNMDDAIKSTFEAYN